MRTGTLMVRQLGSDSQGLEENIHAEVPVLWRSGRCIEKAAGRLAARARRSGEGVGR